jgi:DNA-binding beta-propeller fold protein YncE
MSDQSGSRAPDRSEKLYPNAGGGETGGRDVSRRSLLAGSAAVGATVTAGCLGDDEGGNGDGNGGDGAPAVVEAPTVFVSNTGDGSVTIIDAEAQEVVETRALGVATSFPSNQYTPELTDAAADPLWINAGEGVRALEAGTLSEPARQGTGSGANWQEQTPDGQYLLVSAREPAHTNYRLDADPASETFGEVMGELDRTPEGGRGDEEGPGPCDVTIHPDGAYAYVPDLFGDTLTVLDVEAFEIATQVDVASRDGAPAEPWMGTAAWDGDSLLVEHNDGEAGSESIWDVSDPADPVERARLTVDDGMGEGPLTSEIDPDSAFGYVFTSGSNDVTVVDIEAGAVETRLDLGGSAFVGTWDPAREFLYVPVQDAGEVAVIDVAERSIVDRLDTGPEPYGATAATVRPAEGEGAGGSTAERLSVLTGSYETTYCVVDCACGHRL